MPLAIDLRPWWRLLLVPLMLAVLGAGVMMYQLRRPAAADSATTIQVTAGASLRSVLSELDKRRALRSPRLVEWYSRLRDPRMQIRPGTYQIRANATALQVLEQLRRGRVVLEKLTIIEGWTFAQMRAALNADRRLAHPWRGLSDAQVMAELGHSGMHPEGRFFPDTYSFDAGTPDRRIYQLAFERMQRELERAWQQRAEHLPLKNADQLLVFASIVEKETGRNDERGKVAAVFANRLRIGMMLQSDPTIIYGLGPAYDGDLRNRDMLRDTPYNTYTRAGLPPSPIALPGAASLAAAARPENTAALYFVATGLGDGSHHFSTTYAEHNAALQKYLQRIGARTPRTRSGGGRP